MKIVKYIFLSGILSFLISGCSDSMLNIYPVDRKTEATFFKTQQDMYQGLIGCYSGMHSWLNNGGNWVYPLVSDIMSDDASGGAGKSDYLLFQAVDRFDISIAPSEANIYQSMWASAFTAINRSNTFMKKMRDYQWDDNSDFAKNNQMTKEGSIGEAHFIRAYIYFCSMQMWGHLPLITDTTADAGKEPQAAPQLVYEQIIKDLQKASQTLPESYPHNVNGRITKYAAEALIARVYLYYTGYYGNTKIDLPRVDKAAVLSYMGNVLKKSEVINYLTDVIQNSGCELVEDFESLWAAGSKAAGIEYAGENNKEIVFAIKHGYTSGTAMNWVYDMGARNYTMPPYGRGWGVDVANRGTWDSWDPKDSRRGASLMNVLEEKNVFNETNPYSDVTAGSDMREWQNVLLKKYLRETDAAGKEVFGSFVGNPNSMSSFTDYAVIRFADVLLMAAELGLDAQKNFDLVRNRAYRGAAPSKAPSYENIMEERHREFVGEAIRYWDLLRQGLEKAADAIHVASPGLEVRNGPFIYGTNNIIIKRDKIMATYGLSQIPYQQVSLSNGNLVQNEGW